MTLKMYNRDSADQSVLTDGTPATPANTGAGQANSISPSTNIWRASTVLGGAWVIESSNNTGTNAASLREAFATGTLSPSWSWDFVCPALPTDSNAWTGVTLRRGTTSSGGPMIQLLINQSGQWYVLVGSTAVAMSAPKTSTGAIPAALVPGNAYSFRGYVDQYASTGTTGVVHARMYPFGAPAQNADGSASYLAQTDNGGAAMTFYTVAGELFTYADAGQNSYPTQRTVRHANLRLEDSSAAAGYMGAYVSVLSGTIALSPTSGPVPRTDGTSGTEVTATITPSTTSGLDAKPYALLVEFSAIGDFTDTISVLDTRGAYQSSPVFKFTPPNKGTEPDQYRFTGYILPAA